MQLQSLLPADSLYGLPTAPRSLNRNFHDPFLHQCLLMVGFGLDLESDGSSVSPPAAHCQRQNPQNRHSISGSLPGSSAPGQPKGFRLKSVPAPLPPQAPPAESEMSMDAKLEQLTKLGELKNAGVLTEAEFETQKARILA